MVKPTRIMKSGILSLVVLLTILVSSSHCQDDDVVRGSGTLFKQMKQGGGSDTSNFPDEFQPFGKVIINSKGRKNFSRVDVSKCHFRYFNMTVDEIQVSVQEFLGFLIAQGITVYF